MQTSWSKFIGGCLLITGMSIGGGMLALPVANAGTGFWESSLLLVLCWCVMTFSALVMLEVNLWFPPGSNLITMATSILGKPGKVITWFMYLSLFYTLMSGYISGGTDILDSLLASVGWHFPLWVDSLVFVLLLGSVVFLGIRSVDYVNRGLMFGKLGVYVILVGLLLPHIDFSKLTTGDHSYIASSLMLLITSFGFAHIVPTLRSYYNSDQQTVRRVIITGSLVPLVAYILWDASIMGVLPRAGEQGLLHMLSHDHATSDLTNALIFALRNQWVTDFFRLFISLSMLTAFMGVSLGFVDFMADGLKRNKHKAEGWLVYCMVFIPPLLLVFYKPYLFLVAMSFAGVCCIVLLVLLPNAMAYFGRGRFQRTSSSASTGTNTVLLICMCSAIFFIVMGFYQSIKLLF